MNLRLTIMAASAALTMTSAQAEIRFAFVESAPKDRFIIENASSCATGPVEIVIDLAGSAGDLVFDTTSAGAGVEVFQPFELVAGKESVVSTTPVSDGDALVKLKLASLSSGGSVVFTIDVDDQLETSDLGQIRVAGSEIVGASATVISTAGATSGLYDKSGRAVAGYDACL